MWAVAQVIFPILESLILTWRSFVCYAIGAPLLISILFAYLMFIESPRYLFSIKEYKKAKKIFEYISIKNRRPPFKFNLHEEIIEESDKSTKISLVNSDNIF